MRSLSAFREKLERDRQCAGLSVAKLSWMLGVSVREYRELVEGEAWPSADVWERIEANVANARLCGFVAGDICAR